MRIVFANKYYHLKGGAERYFFELKTLLENAGNEVVPFAMRDPRNRKTEWSRYFVSPVRTERVGFGWQGVRTAGRFLYSFEAKRKFGRLLAKAKPDLVHVHNIYHQISPSILPVAKKRGLPVVMTAHDYKLVSPNYSLFHDGEICERVKDGGPWAAYRHRCVKGSRAASFLCALEAALHGRLGLYDAVDRIIAPSRFMQALLMNYGIDERRIVHVPHFIDTKEWTPSYGPGNYLLYVGRLSSEKGVDVLIRAAADMPEVPVRIVGTGPDEERLQALAHELKAENVQFAGHKSGDDLRAEYAGARAVVVPSVWYEVFGLIVLEAYAAGKPVIASQIGGLGELVTDGETGYLVSAGEKDGLAEAMHKLWHDPDLAAAMGEAGRQIVELDYTPERHLEAIMGVYGELVEGHGK